MLTERDVDEAWRFWTWATEETLLALSQPDLQASAVNTAQPLPAAPTALERGWGTGRLVKRVRLCPKQRRTMGAPETTALA